MRHNLNSKKKNSNGYASRVFCGWRLPFSTAKECIQKIVDGNFDYM